MKCFYSLVFGLFVTLNVYASDYDTAAKAAASLAHQLGNTLWSNRQIDQTYSKYLDTIAQAPDWNPDREPVCVALYYQRWSQFERMLEIRAEKGLPIEALAGNDGITPLIALAGSGWEIKVGDGSEERVLNFLAKVWLHSNLHARDNHFQWTFLHFAVYWQNTALLANLVKVSGLAYMDDEKNKDFWQRQVNRWGGSMNGKEDRVTPLMLSRRSHVTKFLLDQLGANPFIRSGHSKSLQEIYEANSWSSTPGRVVVLKEFKANLKENHPERYVAMEKEGAVTSMDFFCSLVLARTNEKNFQRQAIDMLRTPVFHSPLITAGGG